MSFFVYRPHSPGFAGGYRLLLSVEGGCAGWLAKGGSSGSSWHVGQVAFPHIVGVLQQGFDLRGLELTGFFY